MAIPVTVTVGALVTADDDGVSTTQSAAGAQYLVLNGAKTNGGTANNICQSQSPGGAGALTLNGTLVASGVAYLGTTPRRIYITSAGNDSGRTFTVVGTGINPGIGGQFGITETITGANTSVVSSTNLFYSISSITISGASAAAVTVGANGVATLDTARRVIVTSGGDDRNITFTFVGTDTTNTQITEVVTGANATAATTALCYKTVTSILTSGAVATTLIVGTNGVADSPWVRFDQYASNAQTSIVTTVTGTVNYDIELSNDDPNLPGLTYYQNAAGMAWIDSLDTAVVGATASKASFFTYTPVWARVHLNSGTGSVRATFDQAFYG